MMSNVGGTSFMLLAAVAVIAAVLVIVGKSAFLFHSWQKVKVRSLNSSVLFSILLQAFIVRSRLQVMLGMLPLHMTM